MKNKYVLGIITGNEHVLLIKKLKPEWQANRYNFLGGKIEQMESGDEAIVREIKEESDLDIDNFQYEGYLFRPDDFIMHVYRADIGSRIFQAKQMETEPLALMNYDTFLNLKPEQMIENLHWLFMINRDGFRKEYSIEYA